MRRQLIACAVALAVLAAVALSGSAAHAQVTLNGRQINYTLEPFTIGPHLMVPLDETLSFLGNTSLRWDPDTLTAYFTYEGTPVAIRQASGYAIVGDRAVVMGVPAVIRRNHVLVPLNFLREDLGIEVGVAPGYVGSSVRQQVLGFRANPVEVRQPGAIGIGGVQLLNVSAPAEFPSVESRVNRVYERLNAGIARAMELDDGRFLIRRVTMRSIAGTPTIFVAGVPVLAVTEEDAIANNMSVQELARVWFTRMRSGLRQVFLTS